MLDLGPGLAGEVLALALDDAVKNYCTLTAIFNY